MAPMTQVRRTWAVLDGSGRVVVLLQGDDASAAAEDWVARGYRVEQVPEHEFALDADVA